MRDVNYGYLIRYIHANGASFFFVCMYGHIGKALYYGSYKSPRVLVWVIGVIIFILTIATAFLGKHSQHCPKSLIKPTRYSNLNISLSSPFNSKISYRYYHTTNPNQDITDPEDILKQLNIKVENYWENLHTLETRNSIKETVKNKSGIYIIINKITKNFYIGSGITNKLYTRFSNHCYHANNGNTRVRKSIQQYGLNNFIFGILEYYPSIITKETNLDLLNLETNYICLMQPAFNILTEASNSFGYKHTDETILKMKSLFTEERKELLRKLQYSRKGNWSEESKNKISINNINRSAHLSLNSEEQLKLRSDRFSKTIYLKDFHTNQYICKFKNIPQMHNFICCSEKTIRRALKVETIYIPTVYVPFLENNLINYSNCVREVAPYLKKCTLTSSIVSKQSSTAFTITRKLQ